MSAHLVPITEAKAKLNELIRDAVDENVVLLRHGRPVAVIVGAARFEALLEEIADLEDRVSVFEARESDPDLRVDHEKVKAELGLL